MSMQPVLHSFAYALDYLREQVADVPLADLVAQPKGITNHPAWTIGHLAFACELLGGVIGLEPWLPEHWPGRYGTGSVPTADVTRNDPKDELLSQLKECQARLIGAVPRLTDSQLDQPFPDPAYLEVFPTVRHALAQVLIGHTSFHVGQVSIWRKAMGFSPMRRSFE